jgi:tetratricopeptide (TPR) repeat protein
VLLAASLTLQNPPTADWRTIPVETYPIDSRAQIGSARDAAVRRPEAATIGELGIVLHAWEQFELAALAYADARRLAPADVTWWALSGSLASRMGMHALAAEYFGKAVTLSPSPLLALRHADALLDSGNLDAAGRAYQLALPMPEVEPAARYGLGRVAMAAGDTSTARMHFERAIALTPEFGAAHYALALLQRKAGDVEAARASIARQQQCLVCWPMPPDPWRARVAGVRNDAAALLKQGMAAAGADDARAVALHEEVLAKDPSSLQARTNLITLYARTGNLGQAAAQYRRVIASGTQLADAHRAYGLALAAANRAEEAVTILNLAATANPLDATVQNALGLLYETQGRLSDAQLRYRAASSAAPDVRAYRFNLARVMVNAGDLDAALALLLPLASPNDGESVRYVYAASVVLVRKGDIEAARRSSQDALARARRHKLTDLAAIIERDLEKIR